MKALMIYVMAWFSAIGVLAAIYIAGFFNDISITIFGFLFSALFFAGFGMVLPVLLDEHYARNKVS
jgi:hypothetical protein